MQTIQKVLALALVAAPLAGCSSHADQAIHGQPTFTPPLQVHTRVEAPGLKELPDHTWQVPQGRVAAVHCLVRRGSDWVENMPWRVETTPPMPVAQRTSVEVRLLAAEAGTYQVRCVAGEGAQSGQAITLVVQGESPSGGGAEGGAGSTYAGDTDDLDDLGDSDDNAAGFAAGQPYRWDAHWDESGQDLCYSEQRAFMLLSPAVYDAMGNPLPDPPIRIEARDSAVTILEKPYGVRFTRPGTYEVTAYVEGADSPRLPRVTQVFEVDSTPPKITILSPTRGAALPNPQGLPITVHGVIEDDSGIARASFNGAPMAVAPGARRHEFTQQVQPGWGLNVFKVQASDRCEVPALHAQSFSQSRAFGAANAPTAAVRARFGHKILDDRAPGQASTDASVAGLVQRALQHENFKDVLPEFLSASPAGPDGRLEQVIDHCGLYTRKSYKTGYEVWRRGDFQYKSAEVTKLQAVSGKWEVEVTFSGLRLPVRVVRWKHVPCVASAWVGQFDVDLQADSFTVAFTVEAAAEADTFALRIPEEDFRVAFDERGPHVSFVNKDFMASQTPGTFGAHLKNGVIRHVYGNVLEKNIGSRLRLELTEVLANFVAGLRMERTVDMPLPWARDHGKMSIATAVDHLEVGEQLGDAAGELGLQAFMGPQQGSSAGPGPIRAPAQQPEMRLQGEQSASFAVYDDFINQGLHALWEADSFKMDDLPGALGFRPAQAADAEHKAMDLQFVATTPPVLMPGDHDQEVVMGWGDAWVRAKFNTALLSQKYKGAQPGIVGGHHPDVEVDLYCSIQVRGTLQVDEASQALSLKLAEGSPKMDMHVVRMSNPVYQELASTQLEFFARGVRPRMEAYLSEALPRLTQKALKGVPLPLFQFDGTPIRWRLEHPELTRPAGAHHSVLRGRLVKE